MKCKKLEEINASAYQYYDSQLDNFKKICAPLKSIGIPWFGYMKLFKSGKYLNINNNLDCIKDYFISVRDCGQYFSNEINSSFDRSPKFILVPNKINLFNKKTDHIAHVLFNQNIWNLCNILIYNSQYLEVFYFGMTRNDDHAHNFYIENNHLLHKFIKYFKQSASNIIDTNDTSKLAHFDQSFNFHGKSDDKLFDAKVQKFLQDIKIDQKLIQGKYEKVKLTKREIECLDYLALGYGMKGIADILDLSPRTIESYINNAKEKTGYNHKQLLLTQFIKEFKPDLLLKNG